MPELRRNKERESTHRVCETNVVAYSPLESSGSALSFRTRESRSTYSTSAPVSRGVVFRRVVELSLELVVRRGVPSLTVGVRLQWRGRFAIAARVDTRVDVEDLDI